MKHLKLLIKKKEKKCDIIICENGFPALGTCLSKKFYGQKPFILTGREISGIYLSGLKTALAGSRFTWPGEYIVPDGEKYKNLRTYEKIMSALVKFGKRKKGEVFVINLGGGVIGDLGGFAAATYKRGVKYVQIPTTLLAMADSGVGGKTGIDFKGAKNIVGAFHQPSLVWADIKFLDTLGKRDFISGLAEIIKYGIIKDRRFFEYLERNREKILQKDPECLEHIIYRSYQIKAEIVRKDELDVTGERMLLNFGHTIGHAVEAASGYTLKHGEAISIGMCCANDISRKLGILDDKTARRIETLLSSFGLPSRWEGRKLSGIKDFLRQDKKNKEAYNRFVLIRAIGKTVIKTGLPSKVINEVIRLRTT